MINNLKTILFSLLAIWVQNSFFFFAPIFKLSGHSTEYYNITTSTKIKHQAKTIACVILYFMHTSTAYPLQVCFLKVNSKSFVISCWAGNNNFYTEDGRKSIRLRYVSANNFNSHSENIYGNECKVIYSRTFLEFTKNSITSH